MKRQNENDLTKMFLMSHDTYDKLNDQLKEISSLRSLNDELKNSLKNNSDNAQNKWLNYRNKLFKLNEKKRDSDELSENVLNHLRNQNANDMIDESMKKITASSKKEKIPDKWFRYRNLLFKKKELQNKMLNAKGNKNIADYKKRLKTVKLLNSELAKILNNRKLRNNSKWLKYRHLLYKHGLHEFDEGGDDELYHTIWADKHKRYKRNALTQTQTTHNQQQQQQNTGTQTSFSNKNGDNDKTLMDSFNDTGLANLFTTPVNETIYTFASSDIDEEDSPSPAKRADEFEKQRKYLSATLNARRLMLDKDIKNNVTDINPEDIDDVGTEWEHRSLLTEAEQKQLEPMTFPKRGRASGVVAKKLIKNVYHTPRKNSFTPTLQSTPKTRSRSKSKKTINTGSASTLKDHFKVVKNSSTSQQKGTGRSNILRWESYR